MTDPAKPYTIAFEVRPGYLYVDLKGDVISTDVIRSYVADVLEECERSGMRRIMLYRDIPVILSEAEMFYTVNESLEALRGKKVALVNPHDELQKELDFGMTVGSNRGGQYGSFIDIDDAEKWLLEGDDD